LGDIGGVDPAVIGKIESRLDVVDVGKRPVTLNVAGRDLFAFDAPALSRTYAATHFLRFVGRERELDRSAVDKTGCLAGLSLQTSVQLLRVRCKLSLRL